MSRKKAVNRTVHREISFLFYHSVAVGIASIAYRCNVTIMTKRCIQGDLYIVEASSRPSNLPLQLLLALLESRVVL